MLMIITVYRCFNKSSLVHSILGLSRLVYKKFQLSTYHSPPFVMDIQTTKNAWFYFCELTSIRNKSISCTILNFS